MGFSPRACSLLAASSVSSSTTETMSSWTADATSSSTPGTKLAACQDTLTDVCCGRRTRVARLVSSQHAMRRWMVFGRGIDNGLGMVLCLQQKIEHCGVLQFRASNQASKHIMGRLPKSFRSKPDLVCYLPEAPPPVEGVTFEDERGDRVTISRALLSKVAIAYPDSLPAVVADLTARDEDDEFVVHIPRGETTPLHVRDVRTAINHVTGTVLDTPPFKNAIYDYMGFDRPTYVVTIYDPPRARRVPVAGTPSVTDADKQEPQLHPRGPTTARDKKKKQVSGRRGLQRHEEQDIWLDTVKSKQTISFAMMRYSPTRQG
jgi:hypothetical protein